MGIFSKGRGTVVLRDSTQGSQFLTWEYKPGGIHKIGSCVAWGDHLNMSTDKNDSQTRSLAEYPLRELLPTIPRGALSKEHLRILATRLKEAKNAAGHGPELGAEEARLFAENCDVLRKVGMGLALRNYVLLEIYEARQWRAHFQSVEKFAEAVAGISKSQLMKCIDSAKIAMDFHEAGMGAVAPHGRQVELLAMVSAEHRIAAWSHALQVFAVDGESTETARLALRDYCRDRNVRFGRRKSSKSKNIGIPSSFLLPAPSPDHSATAKKPSDVGVGQAPLSDLAERFIISLADASVVAEARTTLRRKSVATVLCEIVEQMSAESGEDEEVQRIIAGLDSLRTTHPELVEGLRMASLRGLPTLISERLLRRVRENQKSQKKSRKAATKE
jgi:hypothetical protein